MREKLSFTIGPIFHMYKYHVSNVLKHQRAKFQTIENLQKFKM